MSFRASLMVLAGLAMLSCALSCGRGSGHSLSSFRDIPEEGWAYGDTITLECPSDSIAPVSGVAVALRHSAGYKYANIWLELSHKVGDSVVADTVNMQLADKYGRRLGRGTGVSFVKVDTLAGMEDVASARNISLRHIMRVDTVRDVEQIGLIWLCD